MSFEEIIGTIKELLDKNMELFESLAYERTGSLLSPHASMKYKRDFAEALINVYKHILPDDKTEEIIKLIL